MTQTDNCTTVYYGFDLGDAESCIARLENETGNKPEVLVIAGEKSFITAFAVTENGDMKIGADACYATGARTRMLRFKRRFLQDRTVDRDIRRFSAGVLDELLASGKLKKSGENCFYIGCPAGWNKNERERYRALFENTGFPPVRIISESRAALVSACQSRHLQVGCDILTKPVLVIDIGSSTTDFAYICDGHEMDIRTCGEVSLGGGIMDEILLNAAIDESPDADQIRDIFKRSEPWRSYCEFAARRLKEKYYGEEQYWNEKPCTDTVLIRYERPVRLTIRMDSAHSDMLLNERSLLLDGKSFRQVFEESLENVRAAIPSKAPELVFLTGGVSGLPAIREWCESIFPNAVIVCGSEPEFAVAKGLAWCARIDEEMRQFRAEVAELIRSDIVENLVRDSIPELYRQTIDALSEPILAEAAIPVYRRWRNGEIKRLADIDAEMQTAVAEYLRSDEAHAVLKRPIREWLRPVSTKLEEYTMPICARHNVPYGAMSLESYLSASDIHIELDAKSMLAIDELTWLVDSLVSLMVGLFCGGSGIALICSGIPGILIGFAASFTVLAIGKKPMEELTLRADLPKVIRMITPKDPLNGRKDAMLGQIRKSLQNTLEGEKSEVLTDRMVNEISGQIEGCLTKMAEIVEIPLSE